MSVGDWVTLRPLKFDYVTEEQLTQRLASIETSITNINNQISTDLLPRIHALENRATFLAQDVTLLFNRLNNVESSLSNLSNRVNNIESDINNFINPSISRLYNLIGSLNIAVDNINFRLNTLDSNVNDILQLFQPVFNAWINIKFSLGDDERETRIGLAWYKLYRFDYGNATDLKYYLVVVRGLTVNLITNGTRLWSDKIRYPFNVNANDWRSISVYGSPFTSFYGRYDFEANWDPPGYRFGISAINNNFIGQINNDSFWFTVTII
jgi:transcriptional regulator with XRE-family HTH domain